MTDVKAFKIFNFINITRYASARPLWLLWFAGPASERAAHSATSINDIIALKYANGKLSKKSTSSNGKGSPLLCELRLRPLQCSVGHQTNGLQRRRRCVSSRITYSSVLLLLLQKLTNVCNFSRERIANIFSSFTFQLIRNAGVPIQLFSKSLIFWNNYGCGMTLIFHVKISTVYGKS